MTFRQSEYLENKLSARWLDASRAKHAYDYALQFSAKHRYGLNEATVAGIEHIDMTSYAVADAWLKDRVSAEGTVQVVYGDDEVCILPAAEFIAKWQDIFLPARDDAIVLHNAGPGVLFYCHEEELEFGLRKT